MSALRKEERSISNVLESTVGIYGLRESDHFEIDVFQESKKNYKLNRFKYVIKAGKKFNFDFIKSEICLPVFDRDECEYELILINISHTKSTTDASRYLLRSTKNIPFRLNGSWIYEAFLERGDIVEIGFNKFRFCYAPPIQDDYLINSVPIDIIKSNLSISIEGETGTGKTTLAKKIHEMSELQGDFVHLNLSSFSSGLIESELFGHVKGAFTGASSNKGGAFLQAHKGTLFLDEIDSLPKEIQTKLLLFLENYEVRPVGGEVAKKVDVRLIFASGSNLKKLVEDRVIRSDFYYRLLSGYALKLPSLATKKDLIKSICKKFEDEEMVIFHDDLIKYYESIAWPGNIRQLRSHLYKKKIFSKGKKIIYNQVDENLILEQTPYENQNQVFSLEKIKYEYSLRAYIKMGKSLKKTSELLEVSQNTLKNILMNKNNLGTENVINVDF